MIENLKKMRCGACGHDTFDMFKDDEGLIAECTKCKSTSTIQAPKETMPVIGWGENSDGILAQF